MIRLIRRWLSAAPASEPAPATGIEVSVFGGPGSPAVPVDPAYGSPTLTIETLTPDIRDCRTAQGTAILFLNAGVVPRPGSIAAALATLLSDPSIGAVGARIVDPEGLLTEAGRIVWLDGRVTGYARGLDPDAPEAMFRRDVDGCSGFVLVRRALAIALGGHDAAFPPGPFADFDLCRRLRANGYRVVHEPRAIADGGPPVPEDAAQRSLFRARHLESRPPGWPPTPELFARDPRCRKRLLVIDGFVPLRAMGAGYPRAHALLNQADALDWAVTLYPMEPGEPGWDVIYNEVAPGIEVVTKRGVAGLHAFLRERRGFYDAVLVSRPENMRRVRAILAAEPALLAGARRIYDAEALFCTRTVQRAALDGHPLPPTEQTALLDEELGLADGVDAVVAVTAVEADAFRRHCASVAVLSHPVQPRDGPGFAERSGFLFVGRLLEPGSPNYDGLEWFIQAVWPAIRASAPDASLRVVGALHDDPVGLSAPGVILVGSVADLTASYDAARVFVAPARYAAGVPLKVLEAGAAGLPVLTTALIAAQLGWSAPEIAADADPARLAAMALRLHDDAAYWTATRAAAAIRLRQDYGTERFAAGLRAVLQPHVRPPTPSGILPPTH